MSSRVLVVGWCDGGISNSRLGDALVDGFVNKGFKSKKHRISMVGKIVVAILLISSSMSGCLTSEYDESENPSEPSAPDLSLIHI